MPWSCEAQSAAAVSFRLPVQEGVDTGVGGYPAPGGGAAQLPSSGIPQQAGAEPPVAEARLDSAGFAALADALADVQGVVAGYGVPLVFKVRSRLPACRRTRGKPFAGSWRRRFPTSPRRLEGQRV